MSENSGMTDAALMEYLNALRYAARNTGIGCELDKFSEARSAVIKLMADRDRLAAEVLRLTDAVKVASSDALESDARGAALMAERDAMAKDAERFTTYFGHGMHDCDRDEILALHMDAISGAKPTLDQWRSAIDAALSPATSTGSEEPR